MKTQRSTNWVLGLVMLTAGLPLAAQDIPKQVSSPAKVAASATVPAKERMEIEASPAPSVTHTPRLSPWTTEVAKLAQAGIEDGVIFSFIDNSGTFNLGAEQIIHLKSIGVSGDVVTAMLQHDFDLAAGLRPLTTTTSPPLDPALAKALTALRDSPAKPAPTTTPAPVAVEDCLPPEPAQAEPLPVATPVLASSVPADATTASAGERRWYATAVPPPAQQGRQKPASPYRVPETRSVELAPPILVYYGASPTPNLVVIDMFPSSR